MNIPKPADATRTPVAINSTGHDLDTPVQHPRVLVVDDDDEFVYMTKLILRQSGYDVAGATSCDLAVEKCRSFNPDVVLLDLMMPNKDGWQTCAALRGVADVPIIMVSANTNREAVVKSLELGADDYITKPFYNREVVARIQAILRRSGGSARPEKGFYFPEIDLRLDTENQTVILRRKIYYLMPREFTALLTLASRAPWAATYDEIHRAVWGKPQNGDTKAVKNIIFILRQKLEKDPSNPEIILNYRGTGYYLRVSLDCLDERSTL